jgi:hypothetical protein
MHIIDIETIALPDDQLASLKPVFEAPANYKDPEKIKANLTDQEARWKEQAALSAMTGRVAIIGILNSVGGFDHLKAANLDDEPYLLRWFWANYGQGHVAGWNIKGFDLPFLIQRSWIHGIRVPDGVFNGRYFSAEFCTDLMERWSCFQIKNTASLDAVSRACGFGGKHFTGADFAKTWANNKDVAVEYCKHDCELTLSIAKRMGVL